MLGLVAADLAVTSNQERRVIGCSEIQELPIEEHDAKHQQEKKKPADSSAGFFFGIVVTFISTGDGLTHKTE